MAYGYILLEEITVDFLWMVVKGDGNSIVSITNNTIIGKSVILEAVKLDFIYFRKIHRNFTFFNVFWGYLKVTL